MAPVSPYYVFLADGLRQNPEEESEEDERVKPGEADPVMLARYLESLPLLEAAGKEAQVGLRKMREALRVCGCEEAIQGVKDAEGAVRDVVESMQRVIEDARGPG